MGLNGQLMLLWIQYHCAIVNVHVSCIMYSLNSLVLISHALERKIEVVLTWRAYGTFCHMKRVKGREEVERLIVGGHTRDSEHENEQW